jgi:hypothetical protein
MSMRTKLRVPLRLFLRHAPAPPEDATTDDAPTGPPPVPVYGLTVYTGDSVAFGSVPLSAGRVTDLLNEHESFEFVDTYVQSLEDGHALVLRTLVIQRDEICAVAVAGPRGDPKRRTRTRPLPVELRLGHYDVRGNIHVLPGTDALATFRGRRDMVPFTEATVEWEAPDGRKIARYGTLVVNRLLTDWIAPARRDVRPPEVQLVLDPDTAGLAKDFTSQLVAPGDRRGL